MSVFTAQKDTLDALWPHALPHVVRFSKETMLVSPADLYKDISTGDKQLWMTEREGVVTGVVITQVYETQRGTICCVNVACGDSGIAALLDVMNDIERWASSIGCVALEIVGRKGWKRVLPEFEQTGIVLEKSIVKIH